MRCILNIELFYGAAMRVDLSLVKAYVAVVISGSDSSAVAVDRFAVVQSVCVSKADDYSCLLECTICRYKHAPQPE